MAGCGPNKVFCPNFQIGFSQEPLRVRRWNFESFHISMIPTNGAKMKKFWEVRVSCLVDLIWNCPKIRPKTRFFAIFSSSVYQFYSLQQCILSARGKTNEKNFGDQVWSKISFIFCHFLKFGSLIFI